MKEFANTVDKYTDAKKNEAGNVCGQGDPTPRITAVNRLGFCESQHRREYMEDALSHAVFDDPKESEHINNLTPEQLAQRMWTTLKELDQLDAHNFGTTVTTTLYDGKDNLITATLGDAASFLAAYDFSGKLLDVKRLNSLTHKPDDPAERARIEAAGGVVDVDGVPRVKGLAVSRAIGDHYAAPYVTANAKIDVLSLSSFAKRHGVDKDKIVFKVITTSDGFTDGTKAQTKEGHEAFLRASLKEVKLFDSEMTIAERLVQSAKAGGSTDNITVAVQHLTSGMPPLMLGVYDGHGECIASNHVALNISETFIEQCRLTEDAYNKQEFSVANQQATYDADNKVLTPSAPSASTSAASTKNYEVIVAQLNDITQTYKRQFAETPKNRVIHATIDVLLESLSDSRLSPQAKVEAFYRKLDEDTGNGKTRLQRLEENKDVPTKRFIAGIAAIALTLVTGILPGLIVIGAVYALTQKSPKDLLYKTHTDFFKEDMAKIKPEPDEPHDPQFGR